MRKTFLIIVSILLAGGLLSAQDWRGRGRVSGLVFDTDGKPIEGVTVKLVWTKDKSGLEVVTNKDGRWTVGGINKGEWDVDFIKVGYAPLQKRMTISETSRNPEVKVTMEKAKGLVLTNELEEMLNKANASFDQKDYKTALEGYNAILAKFPDAYILWKNIGNCYFAQEQYDKAEEAYRKVLEKNANDSDALQAVGNCYFNRNQPELALEWYGKIQFEKIADPAVLYNIGLNLFKSSKFEEALKYFKRSTEVQKDFEDGYYHLGLTHTSLGKKEEAVATFELFLKLFPKSDKGAQVQGFLDYLKKK